MTLRHSDDEIESERLRLRRITADDLPFIARLHAHPEVATFIGHGKPRTLDESRAWIEKVQQTYEQYQLGQLLVLRKSDGAPIGRCGLAFMEVDPSPEDGGDPYGYFSVGEAPPGRRVVLERELGYTFDRAAWGNGYAREAVATVFRYALDTLKLDRVLSMIHADNERSKKLATHFGARRIGLVRAFGRPFAFDTYLWPIPPVSGRISP